MNAEELRRLDLHDHRWEGLEGGFRAPFDPRPAIRELRRGDAVAWSKLWEDLYHQGDIGTASFAAVPLLVERSDDFVDDWNLFALAASIEEARENPNNPSIPDWIATAYSAAWQKLELLALESFPAADSNELVSSLLAVLAHVKGQSTIAKLALLCEDERAEMIAEADRL